MSDLAKRNTEVMIQETRRMHSEVETLKEMVKAQNNKITTLVNEMSELKKAQALASIRAHMGAHGHGGTVV